MSKNNYYELRKNVLRELADGFSCIYDNFKYFKNLNKHKVKIVSAAEWLLDNIYLIEKEYKCVKKRMPLEYFESLPYGIDYLKYIDGDYNNCKKNCDKNLKNKSDKENINNSNEYLDKNIPRILILAKKYIGEKRKLNLEDLISYIKYYEELEENKKNIDYCFTMGELWAFPLMLRIAVILKLSDYTNELVKVQKDILRENFCSAIKANLKEESLERNIGEYITDIRIIEGINWRNFFEETSLVHTILKNDPAEVYSNMDFESKDYYRHKLEEIAKITQSSEVRVAMNVLSLAQKSRENNEEEYKCHVGYYIIQHGSSLLDGYYHDVTEVISQGMYVAINIVSTFLISFLFLFIGGFTGIKYTLNQFIIAFLIIVIPINEIVQGFINYIVSKFVKVRLVPKLDLSNGIPEKYKTVVVIPALIDSEEKVKELMEKLEVYHCGNDDPNIYFALLSDFEDYKEEFHDDDKKIVDCGIKCAEQLNE